MLSRRAKIRRTAYATFKRWTDGHYCLIEIESLLGLGTRWVVTHRLPNGNETIVSYHRMRSAAEKRIKSVTDCH
jgi:hypothetical protein